MQPQNTKMSAARLHDKQDIRFEKVSIARPPEAGEVRVKIAYAGVCGSDIHNFKTGQWMTRRPSIAGHEFSGVVESIGAQVTEVQVGDPVVADSRVYCGACDNCRSGHQHLCANLGFIGEAIDGGFADYITLPAHLLLKCNSDDRLDVAALAEPLAVALHALARLNAPTNASVLIGGCGPIGALCAVAARLMHDQELLVSDIDENRLRHISALTGAMPVDLGSFDQFNTPAHEPVRHVIDTTGNVGVITHLLDQLSGASIALVGIGAGTVSIDPVHLVERELSLLGCHAFRTELRNALYMLETHPEIFAKLIGPMIGLEDVPNAYAQITSGNASGIKTMIRISAD